MPFKQLDFDQEVVNRIRSIYSTVENHRRTSMALHGRPIESTFTLAEQRLLEVNALASKRPDSKEVQRWAKKFEDFVISSGLVTLPEE